MKPSHIHSFPFLWLFNSFSFLFYLFLPKYKESAGLRRVTLSIVSPVLPVRKSKAQWNEWPVSSPSFLIIMEAAELLKSLPASLALARLWRKLHLSADYKQGDWSSRKSCLNFVLGLRCLISWEMKSVSSNNWRVRLIPLPSETLAPVEEMVIWEIRDK